MNETNTSTESVGPGVTIDVVSDVVCPWCYIGKRRLEAALGVRAGPRPEVRWHPFQLNPDIPLGGVDRRSYLETKFGGPERAREIYARVEAAGREVGIAFAFELIERQPNTVDVHRLIAWAQSIASERVDGLVERLFKAYFTEGTNIGEIHELARLAGEVGYDTAAALAHLQSSEGRAEIAAADQQTKAMGIGGVPFFIFNRRLAVSGAQPPEVLADALAQAETLTS
ncbi:MAG: DsbA family oxidoreductase [Burkholderiaceae bacterium]